CSSASCRPFSSLEKCWTGKRPRADICCRLASRPASGPHAPCWNRRAPLRLLPRTVSTASPKRKKMPQTSALLTVMIAAARKAARGLNRDFGEVENLQVSRKGPADFVSAADHRAEEVIKTELARARPNYGFLMEESGETKGADSQHRWIVDPLDGTTNFLHGIPQFAISIALERQGKLHAAIVYDPIADALFTA